MNGNKRVILHLVFDGILFDRVYTQFEQMENFENRYLLGSLHNEYEFKYIKKTEKIIYTNSLEVWGRIVEKPEVDIIYLHGLWGNYLKAVDFIRKDVVVMWWCYGKEIYENCFGWPPLLPLKIYKPNTYKFLRSTWSGRSVLTNTLYYLYPNLYVSIKRTINFLMGRRDDKLKQMLSRIDFAFTPLDTELQELRKRFPFIHAKPYKLRAPIVKDPIEVHKSLGNILIEHSANISNNHLDIIAFFKKINLDLRNRNIYIPLGYGVEKLAERVRSEAVFEGAVTHCLMDAIPFEAYKKMLSECSHAVFGMIRQSGLGNIFLCFKTGIKVFFFKDSILYRQFKSDGYDVFTIEDDLNDQSIRDPLSPEQALNNYNKYYSRFDASIGSYNEQFEKILKEQEK